MENACARCKVLLVSLKAARDSATEAARRAGTALYGTGDVLTNSERATVERLRAFANRFPGDNDGLIAHDTLVDDLIGVMDSREDAALVVAVVNAHENERPPTTHAVEGREGRPTPSIAADQPSLERITGSTDLVTQAGKLLSLGECGCDSCTHLRVVFIDRVRMYLEVAPSLRLGGEPQV